jgi:hypothetical protein
MPLDIITSGRNLAFVAASRPNMNRNKCKLTVSSPVTYKNKCNLWALFGKKEKLCFSDASPSKVYKIISPPPRGRYCIHSQEIADNNDATVLCSEVSWDLAEEDGAEEGNYESNRQGKKPASDHFWSQESYSPIKSPKVMARRKLTHDFDVWREVLVCHKETGEKRSYFVSDKTDRKVWDEPPSGATKIVYQPVQIYLKHNGVK